MTDLVALNERLLASIQSDDYAGHDPFDFLNSRLFQAAPFHQNRLARLVWLQLGKHLPINLRPILQVPKMRNPKGIALCLAGLLQDYRRTTRPEFLDEAKRLGRWLISQRSDPERWQSPCWGYHFDWQARAFHVPAGKPNIITTCYVARALYALGEQTSDSRLMALALSSARFMTDQLYTEHDGHSFYAYIPGETAFVHNASLWGAAWCTFAGNQTGRFDLVDQALRVTRETVRAQSATGSWVYGTRPHHQFIDGFHTGYILEALCLIRDVTQSIEFDDCIRRGYDDYVSTFITPAGDVRYYKTSIYPLDMHSVAQAVITLLTTGNGPAARKQSIRFGDAGIALGLLRSEDVLRALADQFNYHYFTGSDGSLSHTLIAAFAPFSAVAEALRSLRTQLQIRWFSAAPGHQALAIVSPSSNDGRSFIAANLAVVFSQLCTRTLLVDADLRNPCQDQLFRLGSRLGLSDILGGRCGLEAITPIKALNGLSVLTAGTIPPNPQELFGRSSFAYLMEILRKDYDHLVFDTPSGSLYADVQTIAGECGSALLIAREHHTHATGLIELKQNLQSNGTLVVGSMLNQTQH